MRIAVDGSSVGCEPSGARTRLVNLLRAYAALERRHEIVLFCHPAGGLREDLEPAGVECVPIDPPPGPFRRWLARPAHWETRLVRAAADLLQAETLPVPRLAGWPLLLTVHDLRDLEPNRPPWSPRRAYARFLLGPALRRVRAVIAVSEHTRRRIIDRLGVAADRVVVVENAPDPAVRPVADRASLERFRRRHGIESRFVLALGHLEPRKNLAVLVDAVRLLRERPAFADLSLVCAGRDLANTGRRLLARARRPDKVPLHLTGPLDDDDRSRAFSAAECLAIPSLVEGFGIVPLEAMRAGCPVVAADRGALPEILGDAAELFPAEDASLLARALERLLADPGAKEALVARGSRRVVCFDWSKSARALRDLHDVVGFAAGVR